MNTLHYIVFSILIFLVSCNSINDIEEDDGMVTLLLSNPVFVTDSISSYNTRSEISYISPNFIICKHNTFEPIYNDVKSYFVIYNSSWISTIKVPYGCDIDIYSSNSGSVYLDSTYARFSFSSFQNDVVYSEKQTILGVNNNNRTVNLQYKHAFACISVRLSALFDNDLLYTNSSNGRVVKIIDSNGKLIEQGYIEMPDGEIIPTRYSNESNVFFNSNNTGKIPLHKSDNSSYTEASFYIPEMDFISGSLSLHFYFNTDNRINDFVIPSVFQDENGNDVTLTRFERGKRYILNLVLNNRCLIEPVSFLIEDWEPETINLKL